MPNIDYSPFTFTPVNNVASLPTDMYTHKRVNQFVSDYNNYVDNELEGTNLFSYYHFVASHDAIVSTNLGSLLSSLTLCDASKNCLLQPFTSSSTPSLNTPAAHQMNLVKEYSDYLTTSPIPSIPFVPGAGVTIDLDTQTPLQSGNPMAFDTFVDRFPTSSAAAAATTDTYGIEIFANIQFPSMGIYKFIFQPETDLTLSSNLIWIGDVAICEYCASNATMSVMNNTKVEVNVTDIRKVPIRIQYYCTDSGKKKTQLDVLKMLTVLMPEDDLTAKTLDQFPLFSGILYPPLYAAYVNKTQNSYMSGQFQCYTNLGFLRVGDIDRCKQLYNVINDHKRDMIKGKYDRDRDGIQEVGTLPSLQLTDSQPTFFSEGNPANVLGIPNVFSIYRISVDSRYDKTYQVRTKKDAESASFGMTPISPTLLTHSTSYTDFPGYFPVNPQSIQSMTSSQCKQACNASGTPCGYYFSYTDQKKPQCVLDATGGASPPVYSQVRTGKASATMDVGSGTLSLRNKELKELPKPCATKMMEPTIVNTHDYSRNFKFSKYGISGAEITDASQLGVCSSPEYLDFVSRARDILFNPRLYNRDGTWKEGLETVRDTTAVKDTQDTILTNLMNHNQLKERQQGIDSNDRDLTSNIHKYQNISKLMNADDRYDQKGNILMYLRDDPLPSLPTLNAKDSQLLANQNTILYYTGIITAASLVVLAVTMGSSTD